MRKSKYVGKKFGNWTCVEMGLAHVCGKRTKVPGARNHYYVFERRTSDGKADKIIRLNSTEAARVYRGEVTVESLADMRQTRRQTSAASKVTYYFDDKLQNK